MKVFTIVIHSSCQADFSDQLRLVGFIENFMFTHLEWHGQQRPKDPTLSMRDQVVGYIPKIRVDILVEEKNLGALLETIRSIKGVQRQSIYWISPVADMGEL